MDYPTASTQWPSPEPSSEIKHLINLLFSLADSKETNAGDRMAAEVFAEDGKFLLPTGSFSGSTEIQGCRKDAWITIKSRHHTVLKVYANTTNDIDLIVIGNLAVETVDGAQSSKQFVARILIDQRHATPKIRQYRMLNAASQDTSPFLDVQ